MTDQKLNDLALQAWKEAMGDALTAVKLLRDWTDLGLHEALEHIQKTAHQVGGRCNLWPLTEAELSPAFVETFAPMSCEAHESDPRLAEHRARRGVKKVRGAK
jgi:hypothetical protein